jgi:hypothetical protein
LSSPEDSVVFACAVAEPVLVLRDPDCNTGFSCEVIPMREVASFELDGGVWCARMKDNLTSLRTLRAGDYIAKLSVQKIVERLYLNGQCDMLEMEGTP